MSAVRRSPSPRGCVVGSARSGEPAAGLKRIPDWMSSILDVAPDGKRHRLKPRRPEHDKHRGGFHIRSSGEQRSMGRRVRGCLGLLGLAVLVSGCGAGPVCFSSGRSGPATNSSPGPVTIGTDHSVYAPTDTIVVNITNHLNQTIYLVSQYSSSQTCPLIQLVKVDQRQPVPMNPCFSTEAAPSIESSSMSA